ncbi:aconitase X catalytic domain-containing protein [Castellaniella sp. S9]|uniref:aconitase X catalytic domain-containing protein n=1 Tax=Castellaniella sp. S9 TaxID=2993652 RepID=UPI0022B340B5|nr:aconitase X catalytic domain-containing protein [Castellaniella sp. S9]
MKLNSAEKEWLDGSRGPGVQLAMKMLVAVGEATGADRLIPVSSAHVVLDSFPLGEPGAVLLEELAAAGERFVVPTTTNSISIDRNKPEDVDEVQTRILAASSQLGALSTCSCNPFSQIIAPMFGESLAWSESATAPYLNGVIGARTNREGGSAFASALTGLTPRYGMHLDSERRGGTVFEVDADLDDLSDFNVLGSIVARRTEQGVPVLKLRSRPSVSHLFGFGASLAFLSSLPMYHLVGITPEAPSMDALFPDGTPSAIRISQKDIEDEHERFCTTQGNRVDIVSLGQPHATFDEVCEIDRLIAGRRVNGNIKFSISTNQSVFGLVRAAGVLRSLEAAGVEVTVDRMCFGCDLGPIKYSSDVVVATNSVKLANSAPGTRKVSIRLGSTKECVEAAIAGQWA